MGTADSPGARGSPLVIAGAWDERYAGIKTAVSPQYRNRQIKFIGRIEDADLPALYSGAALFVFPSLAEGFGLPVLEAMACGTAVACSNQSSLPEVGGNAVAYFDPTSCQQMATVLQDLVQDEAKLAELAQKGWLRRHTFLGRNGRCHPRPIPPTPEKPVNQRLTRLRRFCPE
ncbi:MAG: glycosyltransferase [Anaerolineaceae bacterium]|nr:glycosyltransferase [Anaerolineaceae bacterium]